MNIFFLGGAGEVGASAVLLKIGNKNILLDCGIRQSSSKDPLPDFRTIQENGGVDAIIISHAHMDHIGSLPIISKEYPAAKIYMNSMTKDLTRVLLYDSLKIMNNRECEIPLYAEKHVEDMLNKVLTFNFQREFEIFENIKVTLYNAGHIAGASSIYIKSSEGCVFYSGDFSVFSQRTVEGAKFPKLRPDVAILECTYGDKLHSNREIEERRLIELVKQCVTEKGKMLIPAFALGRAQEIMLILKKAINKGDIGKVNIFVDGMIKDINRVYKSNPLYLKNSLGKKVLRGVEPFYDDSIQPVENKEKRNEILESNEPCIIISSSGMLTGGWSPFYAEKIASMENGYIVISGYQDEEAPGRKLLNLLEEEHKSIELNGKFIPIKCKVRKVGLSAHGDKSEIKGVIDLISPNKLFLVHGEKDVITHFSKEIIKNYRTEVYTPNSGDNYEVDIKKPRKQINFKFYHCLKKDEDLTEKNIEELWDYVREHYGDRFFTVEALFYIWSGKKIVDEEKIKSFQRLIVDSVYFENELKRLFLFKARTREQVEESLKPKELKPNEINDMVRENFLEFGYKKAGLMMEEKKVILYFDFPKAVDKEIYNVINEFEEKVSWKVEISDSFNNNAALILIKSLFKDENINKVSYQIFDNKVIVDLKFDNMAKDIDFGKQIQEFKKSTGVNLELKHKNTQIVNNMDEDIVFEPLNTEALEQNAAIKYIEESFKDEEFRPYKKSIKNNNLGRYMELSFITPIIGKRYVHKINEISNSIGWILKISKSCNINGILNLATEICIEKGISLRKNPSLNNAILEVKLKPEKEISKEIFKEIKDEFEHKTGCVLTVEQ